MAKSTAAALKMGSLIEKIKTLVPGLEPEAYDQIAAILDLAGVETASEPEMPEAPESDMPDEGAPSEDLTTKAIKRALKKMGLDGDDLPTGSLFTPRNIARRSRAQIPPYDFEAGQQPATKDVNMDATKATYMIRYGTPDAAVKAVLTDLYGHDFEGKRWNQWKAFNRYIRRPDRTPSTEDMSALSEVILTPDLAAKAIQMGIDVRALKDTMVESVDSLGGVVVPVDFQMRIIERLQGLVVMRGRAAVESTSRDKIEFPTATGGDKRHTSAVRVTWVDETPTAGAAATGLTFGLESIPVHTVMAEVPMSRNLIEDAAFDLAGYLARKFAESSALDEDQQFLIGNGSGKPQGVLPGGLNKLGLTEVNLGDPATITWDGLINLSYAPDSQYRQNAVWMGAKNTYATIATLKNGLGDYLWRKDQTAGQPVQLLGYPIAEQESLPAVAANALPLLFGDPTGYTIVDRVGATVERYLDSQTARQNMVYFVMRRRLGGQVVESWKFAVGKIAA